MSVELSSKKTGAPIDVLDTVTDLLSLGPRLNGC